MAFKKKEEDAEMVVEPIVEKAPMFALIGTDFGREDMNMMAMKLNEVMAYLNEKA